MSQDIFGRLAAAALGMPSEVRAASIASLAAGVLAPAQGYWEAARPAQPRAADASTGARAAAIRTVPPDRFVASGTEPESNPQSTVAPASSLADRRALAASDLGEPAGRMVAHTEAAGSLAVYLNRDVPSGEEVARGGRLAADASLRVERRGADWHAEPTGTRPLAGQAATPTAAAERTEPAHAHLAQRHRKPAAAPQSRAQQAEAAPAPRARQHGDTASTLPPRADAAERAPAAPAPHDVEAPARRVPAELPAARPTAGAVADRTDPDPSPRQSAQGAQAVEDLPADRAASAPASRAQAAEAPPAERTEAAAAPRKQRAQAAEGRPPSPQRTEREGRPPSPHGTEHEGTPPRPQRTAREDIAPAPTTVEVSIGRLLIQTPRPAPKPLPQPATQPRLSLSEYLHARARQRGISG